MKKTVLFLGGLILSVLVWGKGPVWAEEGKVVLDNGKVRCEGVSVWRDGGYKVMGKCYGLVYPYDSKRDRYVLWAVDKQKQEMKRVAEVERGYFEGRMSDEFSKLFITAETTSLPRRPGVRILGGGVVAFAKASGETVDNAVGVKNEVSQDSQETMVVQPVNQETTSKANTSTNVGKLLGRIVVAILVIIGVVVGMVVLSSVMFRKKVD